MNEPQTDEKTTEEIQKDTMECPPFLVICTGCKKIVPDTLLCVYCGTRLKEEVSIPPLKTPEIKILSTMKSLGGVLTVPKIHDSIGGSKESIRVCLSNMVRFGLVDRGGRGKYKISDLGKSELETKKDIKISEPSKQQSTISTQKQEALTISSMSRIFKRAGGTRISLDGPLTLALVLEQVGKEIAQSAVTIAGNYNRKTIGVEDIERAIEIWKGSTT